VSVTTPFFARTLMLPALMDLSVPMAAYTFRRSARSAGLPTGAAAPGAAIADAACALAVALAAAWGCDNALMDAAAASVAMTHPVTLLFFMDCSVSC
jgi:hypothetical protein